MRTGEGDRAIDTALAFGRFADHAHDFMIAGHVHGERVLVTSNLKDFEFVDNVVTPADAIRRFS